MARISIITAFLNEETNLPAFRAEVIQVLRRLPAAWEYEVVLVDDHSTDAGPVLARGWHAEDTHVRYLRLARNCGSHAAFSAGLRVCTGDCAVLLAADLQDPPELVPTLIEHWQQGNDVVWAARSQREGQSWSARLYSGLYYCLMRRIGLDMPKQGADFLLLDRKVIDAYNAVPEKNTSFLALILWLGFRQTSIPYTKRARRHGTTKWSLSRKLKLLIDSLVSFSYAPIRLATAAGLGIAALGMVYALVVLANAALGNPVQGWSSLMIVVLLLGGFQLVMLGILGEYLWRTFDEARGRPRYVLEAHLPPRALESAPRAAAYPVPDGFNPVREYPCRGSFPRSTATGQPNPIPST